jgi:hypothetical protein
VRIIASTNRFVFGEYRRLMKTIRYLGQIDKLFGVPVTTRNWKTIQAIVRVLKDQSAERPPTLKRRRDHRTLGEGG